MCINNVKCICRPSHYVSCLFFITLVITLTLYNLLLFVIFVLLKKSYYFADTVVGSS